MSEPLPHLLRRKAVELGLLGTGGAGKARVLMYHGIGEAGCHRVNVRHIAREVFERHLRLFRSHFHVVRLDELISGERHPRKLTVALTFDDGHRNNLTHALPLLEEYDLPAAFFVTGANRCGLRILWGDLLDLGERHTDRVLTIGGSEWKKNQHGRYARGGDDLLLRDHIKLAGGWAPKQELYDQLGDLVDGPLRTDRLFWELMTDEELLSFARHPLVSLGSHGWWHNDMGRIPIAEAVDELLLSSRYLVEILGRSPTAIAWPDGSFSAAVMEAAEFMGYTIQLAVDYGSAAVDRANPRILDRYGIYDFPVSDRWLLRLIAEGAA